MLLIIVIVVFILTIVIIEIGSLFNCTVDKKEHIDNIYLENDISLDRISLLEKCTGKIFKSLEYNETVNLILDHDQLVFFDDYDIFLNNNIKLSKLTVYPIYKNSTIDIINYNGNNITIYVH